jgi:hypothetical protein
MAAMQKKMTDGIVMACKALLAYNLAQIHGPMSLSAMGMLQRRLSNG